MAPPPVPPRRNSLPLPTLPFVLLLCSTVPLSLALLPLDQPDSDHAASLATVTAPGNVLTGTSASLAAITPRGKARASIPRGNPSSIPTKMQQGPSHGPLIPLDLCQYPQPQQQQQQDQEQDGSSPVTTTQPLRLQCARRGPGTQCPVLAPCEAGPAEPPPEPTVESLPQGDPQAENVGRGLHTQQGDTPTQQGDPTVSMCWWEELEDPPLDEPPPPKYVRYNHSIWFNPMDECHDSDHVAGPSPFLIRPSCLVQGWPRLGAAAGGGASEGQPDGPHFEGLWKSGWAGQVFVLRDVFLDSEGRVFNSSHAFLAGGCQHPAPAFSPKFSKVVDMDVVVNLMASPPAPSSTIMDGNFRLRRQRPPSLQVLAYELPLVVPVMKVVGRQHPATLATRHLLFHRTVSMAVFPDLFDAQKHRFATLPPGTVWRVRRLVQPIFQVCNQPSPSLWRRVRHQYLMHPESAALTTVAYSEEGLGWPLIPPSTPLIPKNWHVVIHRKVYDSLLAHNAHHLQHLIGWFFGKCRVITFSAYTAVRHERETFGRAALFLTVGQWGMRNIVFMPPNTTVVQLQVKPEEAPLSPDLAIALAQASEIRTYVVLCEPAEIAVATGMETRHMLCDKAALTEVLDRASQNAYSAHAVPRITRPLKEQQLGEVLPWWRKSQEEVMRFHQWEECTRKEGRWVYNPAPRKIAWNHEEELNLCDHRHQLKGGIALQQADRFLTEALDPKQWNVRPALKYEWKVPAGKCPVSPVARKSWEAWSPLRFCNMVGRERTFLVIGDSLHEQFTDVFINMMLRDIPKPADWAIDKSIPQSCMDWLAPGTKAPPFCKDVRFDDRVCPGLRLIYLRSDFLLLPASRKYDRMPFTRFPFIGKADVVLVNRGAHFEVTPKYERDLNAFFRYMRTRFPETLVVYRNTPPGHNGCRNATGPLPVRQDPSTLPYHWGEFVEQNEMARKVVEEYEYVYMDVDTMMALRPDGHKGIVYTPKKKVDCLHYCTPGPMDMWMEVLFNVLLWVNPLPHVRRLQ